MADSGRLHQRRREQDGRETELLQYVFSQPNLEDLRGNPDQILAVIDDFSMHSKFLMNIGPDRGKLIAATIAERKPSTMIEVGGYVGYSAIKFGDAVRRAGGKLYLSLEINPVYAAVANLLIDLAGLQGFVRILVGPGHVSLRRLVRDRLVDHVELLFLDHFKDRYLPDLWLVEELGLLKPDLSVLVADNVLGPGPQDYLHWLQGTPTEKQGLLKKLSQASDLESASGNPNLVYETEVHEFARHDGSQDGVAITKVVGVEKAP